MNRANVLRMIEALAVFVVGSTIQPALAQDAKVYPGSQCQPIVGTPDYFVSGSIRNLSTASILELSCPAIRDVVNETSGIVEPFIAQVFYENASTERPFRCALFSNSFYSGNSAGWFQIKTQTNFGGAALKVLQFDKQDNGFFEGNYNFWCTVPIAVGAKTSSIFQYVLVEKT